MFCCQCFIGRGVDIATSDLVCPAAVSELFNSCGNCIVGQEGSEDVSVGALCECYKVSLAVALQLQRFYVTHGLPSLCHTCLMLPLK